MKRKITGLLPLAIIAVFVMGILTGCSGAGPAPDRGHPSSPTREPEKEADVSETIGAYVYSDEIQRLDSEEKIGRTADYLEALSDEGLIEKYSVKEYPDLGLVEYRETDGCLCFVDFREEEEDTTGLCYELFSTPGSGALKEPARSDMVTPRGRDEAEIILVSGLYDSASESLDYYSSVQELFDRSPDINGSVQLATPELMRYELKGKDMVIIECHGGIYPLDGQNATFIRLYTGGVDVKSEYEYRDDMQSQRIAKSVADASGNCRYYATPYFFSYYYGGGGFNDTMIHLGSCHGFGDTYDEYSDGDNYVLSNAFLSAGASAVVGHDNSVYTYYDREVVLVLLDHLNNGWMIGEALDGAENMLGYSDKAYMEEHDGIVTQNSLNSHRPSHTDIRGNTSAVLLVEKEGPAPGPSGGEAGNWQEAYAQELAVYPDRAEFALTYIDSDQTPELLVAEDNSHSNRVDIYTCRDGQAVFLGSFGTFGNVQFEYSGNRIVSEETYGGETELSVYSIEGGSVVATQYLFSNEGGVPEGREPDYQINGYPVSRDEYYAAVSDIYQGLATGGYGYGYSNTAQNRNGLQSSPGSYYLTVN